MVVNTAARRHRSGHGRDRDRAAPRAHHSARGHAPGGISYDDVGGIGPVIDQVREMIELPLKHPELFRSLGIDPPRGVLLHGPPGTGKTLLARAVASESDASFYVINGPEIVGKHFGESEERLREIFEQAQETSPSIIFIDEIDSIAPSRGDGVGEGERRLVAQLLTLMDGLKQRSNLIVIGATNRADALDEALRRPGRFDRELVIGVPDADGRREIMSIHTRGMPLDPDVDIDNIARFTHGFVGADLSALCREAALETLRRNMGIIDLTADEIPVEVLEKLIVNQEDFNRALKRAQPTALREIMIETPKIRWDDIGGLGEVKDALREGIELPLKNPEAFTRLGIRPAKGFLALRPSRNRQDPTGQGRRPRGRGQLHLRALERPALQVVRRVRKADRQALPARPPGRAHRHLHR